MLQNLMIKLLPLLADNTEKPAGNEDEKTWIDNVVDPVLLMIDQLMVPIIIMLGVFGAIYGITLGVMYSRAESTDKRDEYKKRLINGGIGIIVALIILIVLRVIRTQNKTIANWIDTMAGRN